MAPDEDGHETRSSGIDTRLSKIELQLNSLQDIQKNLQQISTKLLALESLKKDVIGISKKLEDISRKYEDLAARHVEESRKVTTVQKEMDLVKAENLVLRSQVKDLRTSIEEAFVLQSSNALEIKGMPLWDGEIVSDYVLRIANFVHVEVAAKDLKECFRISLRGYQKETSIIKVVFVDKSLRDKFLQLSRKARLNTEMIELEGEKRLIFVNEIISGYSRKLLAKTIEVKKKINYKFSWVSNGRIYLRKDESSPAIRIVEEPDLVILCKT